MIKVRFFYKKDFIEILGIQKYREFWKLIARRKIDPELFVYDVNGKFCTEK